MLKAVLHIIGLGTESFEQLSLKTYRALLQAQEIHVWSIKNPVVSEMVKEGFKCSALFAEGDEPEPEDGWELIVGRIEKQLKTRPHSERIVLALPGNPIREGRIVSGLQQALEHRYQVNTSLLPEAHSLQRLTGIMSELRQGWGCPWDREQNHLSLKKYLIEEAYEVIEAIDSNNMHNLCEELGDLLLQVVFHAQIAQEDNQFSVFDVLEGISDKLVRRHPHVFGTVVAETCDEVLFNWDAIKRSEKAGQIENVNHFDIPESLPALLLAEKTQKKAAKVGFDWDGYQGPLDKVREELLELEREIGNHERLEDEFGDLLFSIVNLSRPLNLNAEDALRKGTKKFQARFNKMLEKTNEANLKLSDLTLQEMDFYWDKVKNEEKSGTLGPF